ncbi:uncharacterized protein LOC110689669 [Chenopodium quinoa]|uniref:uncharacterized protein LOC110689669 n=1 Tax=Chenopodium quinoa TaxID=63459 RepID=UPI000B779814|nr:uncharacterized protein LOC110689669 [Chenopodium quinoa]XP_021722132.1 uncharacterized protein LOC110689669 [Chenopodium quinoa]XP_021722133.1 uncharacterized protein LOC110689669 [Chenopodium quinoa]XP_021722134.1 uncharacterized protein LOC110689669 [Chenopodium quinoa]XP_021722135.1 uncharacterized protein LOC110689669 [Chenopodium quinoa]XP_021722137.1 uncharacterized protein LOC110689669 [Chenopodium quinoa]XP_021722138.1 uncharacterized protein LOC110689669 [Chenopodium quinoa]XP_0
MYKGKEMNNHDKLSVLGVCDGDLIMMLSNAAPPSRPFSIDLALDGSAMNTAVFQQQFRGDSYLMFQLYDLYQRDPKLAQAISGNDLNRLQEILRQHHHQNNIEAKRRGGTWTFYSTVYYH